MRKSNELSLKEAIDQLLDEYRLRGRMNEVAVSRIWEKTMGTAISKRTDDIRIKNKELIIHISSAALKNELLFRKDDIMEMINKELGGEFVTSVKIQ